MSAYLFYMQIALCFAAVFFIIGLSTFLSGCGTKIPNTCFTYYETEGTIYGSQITNHMCSECAKKDSKKKCVQYNYYTCYDGYVKIRYSSANKTCLYDAYNDEKYFTDLQNKLAYYYPVGQTDTLFVSKTDNSECSLDDDGLQGLTYTGITFLSLCGFALVACFVFYIIHKIKNHWKASYPSVAVGVREIV